jgi:hypothetical protein
MPDAPRGGQRDLQSPETTWPLPGPRRLPGSPDSHRRLPPDGDPRSHRARASSSPRPVPRLLPARFWPRPVRDPRRGGVRPGQVIGRRRHRGVLAAPAQPPHRFGEPRPMSHRETRAARRHGRWKSQGVGTSLDRAAGPGGQRVLHRNQKLHRLGLSASRPCPGMPRFAMRSARILTSEIRPKSTFIQDI